MTVVPNVGYRCIFLVSFRHVVVRLWPGSKCLITTFVRRARLSKEVCSSYELQFLFNLVKVFESFFRTFSTSENY